MEYSGKPVKASRLFAGHEHEQAVKELSRHFNKPADFYKQIKYDASLVLALKKNFNFSPPSQSVAEGLSRSSFHSRALDKFASFEEAYHCLVLDIIQQQFVSTQLVINGSNVKRIFVDGGFGNNAVYMHLLAIAFSGLEVYAASVNQATAMGAALAIHREWNKFPLPADMVKLKYYKATGNQNPVN
jgi:hypothetical protein